MFSLDATLIRLSACSTLTSSFTVLADICKALPAPSMSFWRLLSPTPQPTFLSLTQSASAEAVVSPGRRLGLVAVQYLLHQLLHREARAAVPIAASPLDPMNCRKERGDTVVSPPAKPSCPPPPVHYIPDLTSEPDSISKPLCPEKEYYKKESHSFWSIVWPRMGTRKVQEQIWAC